MPPLRDENLHNYGTVALWWQYEATLVTPREGTK
jgi:hypothetical protein